MPTVITTALRIGLWEAHKRRCTYCGEPLGYRELEVDHIIPQHLGDDPPELVRVLSTLSLPPDFDLDDRRNLLPAHRHCNNRKAASIFKPENVRYFQELAAGAAVQVGAYEERYLTRNRADRVLAALHLALELGELSKDEVVRLVNKGSKSEEAFEVLKEIEFSNRILQGILERADVSSLLDEPLLPRKHGLDELKMVRARSAGAEQRAVITCREWATAVSDGFYPATNYDIKEEAFFKRAYSVIRAFSIATVAETSYLDESAVGLDSLEFLPATLLPVLSRDGADEIAKLDEQGASIADLVRDGRVEVEESSRNHLSFTFSYLGQAYWTLLRADLNNDGIEDMLVSTYKWATQGTFGFGDVMVLTRLGPGQRFQVVEGIDLLPKQPQNT
jgi:hypothetical protein